MAGKIRILITGGSGFIGRNLNEHLCSRYEVLAPARSELNLLDADMVKEYLAHQRFDLIINAATWNATRNSPRDLSKVLANNLRMFFNLARNDLSFGRMLNLGSGAVYSRPHWIPLMKEEYFDSHVPQDDYGFSKYIIQKYVEGTSFITNLVLFGVYGKYEDWEIRFISNACCKALYGLPITLRQNVFFDYLYIDDLAKIIVWFIENLPRHKVYNVCTGKALDLAGYAAIVCSVAGKDLPVRAATDGLGMEYSGDNTRLLAEMGGFPFSPPRECIEELYSWYEENLESISREKLLMDK